MLQFALAPPVQPDPQPPLQPFLHTSLHEPQKVVHVVSQYPVHTLEHSSAQLEVQYATHVPVQPSEHVSPQLIVHDAEQLKSHPVHEEQEEKRKPRDHTLGFIFFL